MDFSSKLVELKVKPKSNESAPTRMVRVAFVLVNYSTFREKCNRFFYILLQNAAKTQQNTGLP